MIAITVGYKSTILMNSNYYLSSHVPMIENTLTEHGLISTEVRKIVGTPSGEAAPYQFITTLYFENMPTFSSAFASNAGRALLADNSNFYEGIPDIMIGET